MIRLPAIVLAVSALVAGCGPFMLPVAESSHLSVKVDGDPGFVSFGGFRWQLALVAPNGKAVATWDPAETPTISVVPGDYRLDVMSIAISDAVLCVDAAAPNAGSCTRQEGPPNDVCDLPVTVPAVADVVLSVRVVGGKTCNLAPG